jgi:hypothetical protein
MRVLRVLRMRHLDSHKCPKKNSTSCIGVAVGPQLNCFAFELHPIHFKSPQFRTHKISGKSPAGIPEDVVMLGSIRSEVDFLGPQCRADGLSLSTNAGTRVATDKNCHANGALRLAQKYRVARSAASLVLVTAENKVLEMLTAVTLGSTLWR